ncbi:PhoU domain-containing protein [Mycobacterium angelicum]|uniref:PhoU domain-containing protein n=1 Tax=Mycobacterium angelicum TaxID=470074 RepID=A0A1W9ZXB9_MYCAN|nr:PhoU domain-containing protein [Mycobacterium angelicum]MCV7199665.1 phosphate transport system regulatory protein PhoU [Mycobacterium angelicum]ORA22126.1 hypothetical protein BST12_09975 [Mycobacterium angelicum]
MTSAIGDGLAALTFQLAEMSAMASQAMDHATRALLSADVEAAKAVTALHEHTVAMRASADETAFLLLALQSPSAANLRQIVNAIRIAGDAERMSELAVQVAEIARRRHPEHAVPSELNRYVAELSSTAIGLGRAIQEVLVSREPGVAARRCSDAGTADDATRIVQCYQGFADHARHIAGRFVFQTNGHRPLLATTK